MHEHGHARGARRAGAARRARRRRRARARPRARRRRPSRPARAPARPRRARPPRRRLRRAARRRRPAPPSSAASAAAICGAALGEAGFAALGLKPSARASVADPLAPRACAAASGALERRAARSRAARRAARSANVRGRAQTTRRSSPPRAITIVPASSSRRTTADDAALRLLDDALRCGGWNSISSRSICAPRSDMFAEHPLLDRPRSTPRSASARSFWSTSRSTSWIERSSSLTMSSKTNSSRRTSSPSSLSVLGERVEHVALGRAVGVVEDVGERLDAAGGRVLLLHDGLQLAGA